MTFLSRTTLAVGVAALTACSLYQSSGRKSLENNAYSIANGTASLLGCGVAPTKGLFLLQEDERAWVFQNEQEPREIRVDLKSDLEASCRFQFDSEPSAYHHLDDVVEYTQNHR